jgi:Arc/MetJ family transcription regulator
MKGAMASKPRSASRRKTSGDSRIRRKNLNIDQDKLDRVVEITGAATETEAVDQALAMMLFRQELLASLDDIPRGEGELVNYFEGGYAEELEKQ